MTRYPVLKKWLAGALFVVASQSVAAQQQSQLSAEVPVCDEPPAPVLPHKDSLAADSATLVVLQPEEKFTCADSTILDSTAIVDSAVKTPEKCESFKFLDMSMVTGNIAFTEINMPGINVVTYGYTTTTPFYEPLPLPALEPMFSALPLLHAGMSYPAPSKAPARPRPLAPFPSHTEALLPKRLRTEEEPEIQNS